MFLSWLWALVWVLTKAVIAQEQRPVTACVMFWKTHSWFKRKAVGHVETNTRRHADFFTGFKTVLRTVRSVCFDLLAYLWCTQKLPDYINYRGFLKIHLKLIYHEFNWSCSSFYTHNIAQLNSKLNREQILCSFSFVISIKIKHACCKKYNTCWLVGPCHAAVAVVRIKQVNWNCQCEYNSDLINI